MKRRYGSVMTFNSSVSQRPAMLQLHLHVYIHHVIMLLNNAATVKPCFYRYFIKPFIDNIYMYYYFRFQELVHNVHLTPSVSNPVHKRFLIDCEFIFCRFYTIEF